MGLEGAIHPDDLACVLGAFQEAVNSERPFEVEGRFRRSDGEFRWFLVRGSPLRDASGKVVKWCGTNTDIDQRKRAEEALRESEGTFRLIVDSIPGFIVTTSAGGEIELASHQILEYFGMTFEEVKNWATNDRIHPDDLQNLIAKWSQSVQTGPRENAGIMLASPLGDGQRPSRIGKVPRPVPAPTQLLLPRAPASLTSVPCGARLQSLLRESQGEPEMAAYRNVSRAGGELHFDAARRNRTDKGSHTGAAVSQGFSYVVLGSQARVSTRAGQLIAVNLCNKLWDGD